MVGVKSRGFLSEGFVTKSDNKGEEKGKVADFYLRGLLSNWLTKSIYTLSDI
jgi:hypothetical protein